MEIRPVSEPEDFGEAPTPALHEQEAKLRAQTFPLSAPRFEQSHDLLIAGLNETYTFDALVNIPSQWQRFAPYIGKVPGQVGQNSYGVLWNYKAGQGCDYLSGVEVTTTDQLPLEFSHVRLPALKYAVFEHKQHVSSIAKTIDAIWKQWIPTSGCTPVHSPTFERYTKEFNPRTGTGGIEIWIPIEQ